MIVCVKILTQTTKDFPLSLQKEQFVHRYLKALGQQQPSTRSTTHQMQHKRAVLQLIFLTTRGQDSLQVPSVTPLKSTDFIWFIQANATAPTPCML